MSDFNQKNNINYSLPNQIDAMQQLKEGQNSTFQENKSSLQGGIIPLSQNPKTNLGGRKPLEAKRETEEDSNEEQELTTGTPNLQNKFNGNIMKSIEKIRFKFKMKKNNSSKTEKGD